MLRQLKNISISKLVILFGLILYLLHFIERDPSSPYQRPIISDAKGYYAYLPALIIYQDFEYEFLAEMDEKYYKVGQDKHIFIEQNGRRVNKTFPGVALLYLPFFLFAHFLASLLYLPADGYSHIYQLLFDFGLFFSAPSLLQTQDGKKVTLGLDLQGGLHMLLGIKSEIAIESRIKSMAASVKYIFDDEEIIFDELRMVDGEKITFELLDTDDVTKAKALLKKEIEGTIVIDNGLKFSVAMTEAEVVRTEQNAIQQAVDTIRNRLNEFGLAEPTVAKQGEDKILVEVPGIKTQEDEQRIRELIARAAHLQLMAVDEDRNIRVNTMSLAEAKSYGDVILPDVNTGEKYLLRAIPVLDGSMLTDAKVGFDENNQPVINFTLNGQGAKIFGDFTGVSVGKRMAVVLDNKV